MQQLIDAIQSKIFMFPYIHFTHHLFLLDETKLYVGNVSFDTEINTLRELFQDYGPVIDLYMPLDQSTGSSRGFAFVTLEPENAARAIEEVDGWEVDGRELRVNEAQPKGSSYNNNNGDYNDEEVQQDKVNEW